MISIEFSTMVAIAFSIFHVHWILMGHSMSNRHVVGIESCRFRCYLVRSVLSSYTKILPTEKNIIEKICQI